MEALPEATIVCSPLAEEMVSSFYGIRERIKVVEDGEEISLGEDFEFFSHSHGSLARNYDDL